MESALLALHCYLRALSHKIRTPLSIIQNELSYLSTKISPAECQRALQACKTISELIKSETTATQDLKLEQVSWPNLVERVFPVVKFEGQQHSFKNVNILADSEKLAWAIRIIQEELKNYLPKKSSDGEVLGSVRAIGSNLELSLIFPFSSNIEDLFSKVAESTSLSEFFCLNLDADSTLLPIADTILISHGWRVSLKCHKPERLVVVFTVEVENLSHEPSKCSSC